MLQQCVATKMSKDEVSDTNDHTAVIFATAARNQPSENKCVVDEPKWPRVSKHLKYIVQGDLKCKHSPA